MVIPARINLYREAHVPLGAVVVRRQTVGVPANSLRTAVFLHGWQGPAWSNRKPALRLKARQLPSTQTDQLLNVKFSPSTLAGEDGLRAHGVPAQLLKAGIQHIQFNVVDRKTLLDAKPIPKHKNLVVRVAGYSALFVELSKAIQDDIINRTEHVL